MDKKEAKQIINEQLKRYRSKSYEELTQLIDAEPITYDVQGNNYNKVSNRNPRFLGRQTKWRYPGFC